MICKKCGISEMECDCPQWSPEAQAILLARGKITSTEQRTARLEEYVSNIALLLSNLSWSQFADRTRLREIALTLKPNPNTDADKAVDEQHEHHDRKD